MVLYTSTNKRKQKHNRVSICLYSHGTITFLWCNHPGILVLSLIKGAEIVRMSVNSTETKYFSWRMIGFWYQMSASYFFFFAIPKLQHTCTLNSINHDVVFRNSLTFSRRSYCFRHILKEVNLKSMKGEYPRNLQ